MREYLKFYIDGQWRDPATLVTLDVENPATAETCGRVALGSAADVDRAVSAARRAFHVWSKTAREERLAEAECHEALYYTRRCSEPLFAAERALSACWQKVGLYSALNPGGVVPGLPPLP